jgi:type IV fimbrial biogenesis protein FimT
MQGTTPKVPAMALNASNDSVQFRAAPSVRREPGFTLIELMVTIFVGAILASIAIPAFQSFVMNDRDSAQINSLAYSFNYARSEAVKEDLPGGVTVCPSTGAVCSGTTAWAQGWIVYYTDASGNTQILQTVPALAGNNTVTPSGAATAGTGITFLSSGMATGVAGTMTAPLQIKVCDQRGGSFARQVVVNQLGRVAATQTAGFAIDGITPLACP